MSFRDLFYLQTACAVPGAECVATTHHQNHTSRCLPRVAAISYECDPGSKQCVRPVFRQYAKMTASVVEMFRRTICFGPHATPVKHLGSFPNQNKCGTGQREVSMIYNCAITWHKRTPEVFPCAVLRWVNAYAVSPWASSCHLSLRGVGYLLTSRRA